ncbi:11951_t:CDS:2 [Entrophospora sp. SA101]|nr:11951_t:CDS:2 [Entrophospora sp. SA101]CAJ0837070.1 6987_t:CDS:2 [Entrophospora sp. SA101]CAJ0890738.1 13794_t:CDS:2 [Entrophospora sp. SA101]
MLPIDQEIRSKNVIANPGPLGLSAFAMTTFVYSMFSVEVLDIKIPQVGLGLALFYGGFIQLLAGMWEMKNGNTFGATVFSSYDTLFMLICALRTNLVMISALFFVFITYIFLGIGKFTHNTTFDRIGGGFGAQLLTDETSYFTLPLWPRNLTTDKVNQKV